MRRVRRPYISGSLRAPEVDLTIVVASRGCRIRSLWSNTVDMDVLAVSAVCLALIVAVTEVNVLAEDADVAARRKQG